MNLESFFRERRNRIVVWLIILLFLLLIFILITRIKTPVIVFLDENGTQATGDVFLGNRKVGSTEGIFIDMPRLLCFKQNTISLKTEIYKLVWETKPSDCGPRQLKLTYDSAEVTRTNPVTLKLLVKETGQLLTGSLYINNNFISNINGQYPISRQECKEIKNLTLKTDDIIIEWSHNPDWCDLTDEIEYQAAQDTLE